MDSRRWTVGMALALVGCAVLMGGSDPNPAVAHAPDVDAAALLAVLADTSAVVDEARTMRWLSTSPDSRIREWASREVTLASLAPAEEADCPVVTVQEVHVSLGSLPGTPAPRKSSGKARTAKPKKTPAAKPSPPVPSPRKLSGPQPAMEIEPEPPVVAARTRRPARAAEPVEVVVPTTTVAPPPVVVAAAVIEPAPIVKPKPIPAKPILAKPILAKPIPAKPIPTVQAGAVDVWSGAGTEKAHEVAMSRIGEVEACYGQALQRDATVSGVVEVEWNMLSGRVSIVTTPLNTTGDPELGECVANRVRRWRFPRGVYGQASWQLDLEPQTTS